MKNIIILVFILFSCHNNNKKNQNFKEQQVQKVDTVIKKFNCSELKSKIETKGDIKSYNNLFYACLDDLNELKKYSKIMIDKYNYQPAAENYVHLFIGFDYLNFKKLKLEDKKILINYLNKINKPDLVLMKNIRLLLLSEIDNVNNYDLDSIKNKIVETNKEDGLWIYKITKRRYVLHN